MTGEKWWCTPCKAWRFRVTPQTGGPMCATCRSGRIRPATGAELEELKERPKVAAANLRLDDDE